MKYIRYAFLVAVLILCVTLALANRAPVTLALWPGTVSAFVGFAYAVTLPLFVVVGVAAGVGLVVGLVWEWLREREQRSQARYLRREVEQMRQSADAQHPASSRRAAGPRDQVLAILDEAERPR